MSDNAHKAAAQAKVVQGRRLVFATQGDVLLDQAGRRLAGLGQGTGSRPGQVHPLQAGGTARQAEGQADAAANLSPQAGDALAGQGDVAGQPAARHRGERRSAYDAGSGGRAHGRPLSPASWRCQAAGIIYY